MALYRKITIAMIAFFAITLTSLAYAPSARADETTPIVTEETQEEI